MRELILLRHAHAEPAAAGQDDHQRGLSATGRAEAQAERLPMRTGIFAKCWAWV